MVPQERRFEEYVDASGVSPFRRWFDGQDFRVRAKVSTILARVAQGNDGSIKSVGSGVCEMRIDWGPGYRVYFGFDGPALIVLLVGGSKQRQDQGIAAAKQMWANYKLRKKKE